MSENLDPNLLFSAYTQGIFPMAHPELDGEVYWYAPDPRAILPVEDFHCPTRLRKTVDKKPFEIRYNTAFREVMQACAAPRKIQKTTWISSGIIEAYCKLHALGFAHSVEAWQGDALVGGLYGVSISGFFAGESMFFRETDASKVCLVHLIERMRERGMPLLDVQYSNPHLEQFGVIEIPREEYEARLAAALDLRVHFA
ncbi:leucyl/phenylalanyl-tRNA--protein transferase [Bradymonas sediminis]|uniref:Leucyl/phenylalanyl-tRNA--protein transferase n=1 Tax=Bradymonas sediminis TaxID=1548548 RepID=A0A2Z4FMH7_9DELT|nr:leucyl/phenylalanyl-tRNA--protein transferase [Bradymonas sediminis]AWV90040.1 leucyl/phenylalanyl-tRNA--protein transferase [Bradymonas sediminis]TDP76002.1 leucyl/phenylalanyl-tRNA--protein transferase [Bradymonas sediminis]